VKFLGKIFSSFVISFYLIQIINLFRIETLGFIVLIVFIGTLILKKSTKTSIQNSILIGAIFAISLEEFGISLASDILVITGTNANLTTSIFVALLVTFPVHYILFSFKRGKKLRHE